MPARVSGRVPDYLFGQSAGEAERLRLQARMFAPYTARFLQDAGISPGMKVLDVGTGAGDVALLAAGLAGQQGTVVGIDFNAKCLVVIISAASRMLVVAMMAGRVVITASPQTSLMSFSSAMARAMSAAVMMPAG